MRYRRVKGATEKFESLSRYITKDAASHKGMWKEVFGNDNPVFLEMGCGKGKFVTEMAKKNPQYNYIGVEGQEKVLLRAAQRAYEDNLNNITFVCEFLRHPEECFEKDEISGLYLNFSDPWPKARHAKRRLTHSRYLNGYKQFLKPGGEIRFKTDNDDLFDFSVEEIMNNGFTLLELTYDLHSTIFNAAEVTTEYEDKFRLWGKKIKYLKCRI
ncbi:MAG: tRNA (guanosine(46)-N7)-methyltransferase TrmB [Bacillota bacterium]|nr:tRNA (guanosine(46)-N7)-methyltransferase TrmB [Bacillota bacterium]